MKTSTRHDHRELLELLDENDRKLMTHLAIPFQEGKSRIFYLASIRKSLEGRYLREHFKLGLDELDAALLKKGFADLERRKSWDNLLNVADLMLGPIEDLKPPRSEKERDGKAGSPRMKEPTTLHNANFSNHSALKATLTRRVIDFRRFQGYENGLFHDAQERVLFEYFLMLSHHYRTKHGALEFYKKLDHISSDTGVARYSVRRFIKKVGDLGIVHVRCGGRNLQNYYRIDEATLSTELKSIYPDADPKSLNFPSKPVRPKSVFG